MNKETQVAASATPRVARKTIARQEIQERQLQSMDGYLMLGCGVALHAAGIYLLVSGNDQQVLGVIAKLLLNVFGTMIFAGLYMLQPNEAALLSLFGQYKGTDRSEGD